MKRISTLVLAAVRRGIHDWNGIGGRARGSWYIAPQVNALWLDDARVADDDAGFTLAFGRTLSPNWDPQLSAFGSEHDRAGNDDARPAGLRALAQSRVLPRRPRESIPEPGRRPRAESIDKPGRR